MRPLSPAVGGGASQRGLAPRTGSRRPPRQRGERRAQLPDRLLERTPRPRRGPGRFLADTLRPDIPRLETDLVPASLGMNLLCMSEEAYFELFGAGPTGLDGVLRLEGPKQPPSFGRETAHLPRLACQGDREKRRPKTPVEKRHLCGEKLREQDVGMLGEVRQDGENEATPGVAPPGAAKGLPRQKGDDVRQSLVLR